MLLNNKNPGGATPQLQSGNPVQVGMIPVGAALMPLRYLVRVFMRGAGRHGREDVVGARRGVNAVAVKSGRAQISRQTLPVLQPAPIGE
jgi:hypothetical protein